MPRTYYEMVEYVVENCTTGAAHFRYVKWVAYMILSEIYGKTVNEVAVDVGDGIMEYEKKINAENKLKRKLENETNS